MSATYTGWLFTDAVRLVACPKCQSKAGDKCRMPSGRVTKLPHWQRGVILKKEHPGAIKAATRTSVKP